MRNSWSDLFVLGLAQISGQVAIPSLLSIIVSHQQNRLARDNTPINVKEVTASVCKIHDYVQTLAKLNITHTEFAYLRAIALFGAGNSGHDIFFRHETTRAESYPCMVKILGSGVRCTGDHLTRPRLRCCECCRWCSPAPCHRGPAKFS